MKAKTDVKATNDDEECHVDADGDINGYSDAKADGDAKANGDADADGDAKANGDAEVNGDAHADADADVSKELEEEDSEMWAHFLVVLFGCLPSYKHL